MLGACKHRAATQSPIAMRGEGCGQPAQQVFFEFQVESPARVIPDSTHPHPSADPFAAKRDDPTATIVQFVVDTTGHPVAKTLRFLKVPSSTMAESVTDVFSRWRFMPATLGACRVPQLLQTTVVM
jgi:hypothetical protein